MTPAGSVGGAVGRLGNEDDTYMEANLLKTQTFDDGSWARYKLMLADGVETSNDWKILRPGSLTINGTTTFGSTPM